MTMTRTWTESIIIIYTNIYIYIYIYIIYKASEYFADIVLVKTRSLGPQCRPHQWT